MYSQMVAYPEITPGVAGAALIVNTAKSLVMEGEQVPLTIDLY